jgi:hypothetical protein
MSQQRVAITVIGSKVSCDGTSWNEGFGMTEELSGPRILVPDREVWDGIS